MKDTDSSGKYLAISVIPFAAALVEARHHLFLFSLAAYELTFVMFFDKRIEQTRQVFGLWFCVHRIVRREFETRFNRDLL
jgi:hypothetical protein